MRLGQFEAFLHLHFACLDIVFIDLLHPLFFAKRVTRERRSLAFVNDKRTQLVEASQFAVMGDAAPRLLIISSH